MLESAVADFFSSICADQGNGANFIKLSILQASKSDCQNVSLLFVIHTTPLFVSPFPFRFIQIGGFNATMIDIFAIR